MTLSCPALNPACDGKAIGQRVRRDAKVPAYSQAGRQFPYLGHAYCLSKEGPACPDRCLAAITGYSKAASRLDFARKVTGAPHVGFAAIQATGYRQRHFLKQHDHAHDPRLLAYGRDRMPDGRADRAGMLRFCDRCALSAGPVAEGDLPAFNALFWALQLAGWLSLFADGQRKERSGGFGARRNLS